MLETKEGSSCFTNMFGFMLWVNGCFENYCQFSVCFQRSFHHVVSFSNILKCSFCKVR